MDVRFKERMKKLRKTVDDLFEYEGCKVYKLIIKLIIIRLHIKYNETNYGQ